VKKKTLVISVLLVLTEIASVCYFVGCSTMPARMGVSQVAKEPSEPLPPELVNVSEDEIWVIARPETQITTDEDTPGCGALLAKLPGEDKEIPLPLKHTNVNGEIIGYIATVEVTQQFHNPYDEKIEAVYVFPLPRNAAINEFIMTIGDRRIRGIIRERAEAERIYEQARSQGYVASLLTQERPNIFTQKVANIEPGKEIDINIKYFNTLAYSKLDSIPNKDFVLRYKVAGKTIKSALVTHHDKRGGYFTLMLYPPENLSHLKRAPMEMIFVLDCSGSMSGKPMALAKRAMTRALKQLQSDDTFQVIRFSNNASQLGPAPIVATVGNIRKGLKYIEQLNGSGGTQMIEGIKAALDFPHDPRRLRVVSFMTDGYIGNETQILSAIHDKLSASRIFSFGVGSSPNRYLLDRMAKIGKGAVAYVGLNDSAVDAVDSFYKCISHPALTDVTINWGQMEVRDVYPRQIPDLFVGRPIILTGRFKGKAETTVKITGRVGNSDQQFVVPFDPADSAARHKGIACVWARKKIEVLANQSVYDNNPELPEQIKQVALEYGLMSAYTAFVAVDSSRITEGDHGVTVAVPVPVPDGVRYETTVQNDE